MARGLQCQRLLQSQARPQISRRHWMSSYVSLITASKLAGGAASSPRGRAWKLLGQLGSGSLERIGLQVVFFLSSLLVATNTAAPAPSGCCRLAAVPFPSQCVQVRQFERVIGPRAIVDILQAC